jgi:co-chaperonin GroES (HSP10)
MSKTYLMGDGKLSEEERILLDQNQVSEEDRMKEIQQRDIDNEKQKKIVTLEMLFATRISPLEDRILVYPDPVATVTESGIIKPQEVVDKERPLTGTVIAVGPGKKVEQTVTNVLLLNILLHGTDIPKDQFEKLKEETAVAAIPLQPGDRIMYGRMAGTDVEDLETKTMLKIMRPTDIFAKV